MNNEITIKHFTHTGHSNWVLTDADGNVIHRDGVAMYTGTRNEAVALAKHYAKEMDFESIEVEYWYGGKKKTRAIKHS